MIDAKLIDRIAKLLELSKSPNEHEASSAAEHAARLMAKHQIEMADVDASRMDVGPQIEEGRIDGEEDAPLGRMENWHKNLFGAVVSALGGKGYWMGRGKHFIFRMVGPKDSIATARYLFSYLEKQIARLSREAQRTHFEPSNAWRRSYCLGVVTRVHGRLQIARSQTMSTASSTALVWVDKTKQAIDQRIASMGELRKPKVGSRKRPDATSTGYRDGDRVDLGSRESRRLGEEQKKLA